MMASASSPSKVSQGSAPLRAWPLLPFFTTVEGRIAVIKAGIADLDKERVTQKERVVLPRDCRRIDASRPSSDSKLHRNIGRCEKRYTKDRILPSRSHADLVSAPPTRVGIGL